MPNILVMLPALPVIQRMEPRLVREGILPCSASSMAPMAGAEAEPTRSFSRVTVCSSRSRLMGLSR
jgi:hypothetical protein